MAGKRNESRRAKAQLAEKWEDEAATVDPAHLMAVRMLAGKA